MHYHMSELKRILYVEDEPDIQAVAKIALETVGGFELKVFSSGEEALANAVSYAPDLLLLDVMMPGMDGPTTLKALKELPELANTPAIYDRQSTAYRGGRIQSAGCAGCDCQTL